MNYSEAFHNFSLGFGASEHNLAIDKDQQHYTRFHHSVNESRKQFRLIRAELAVDLVQLFQSNGKPQVNGSNEVLYFKLIKLNNVAQLLHYSGKLSRP